MRRHPSLSLFAALFVGLSILMVVSGYAYYKREEGSIQAQRYRELRAIATLKVSQIVDWRNERISDAKHGVSHLAAHQEILASLSHHTGGRQSRETIREMEILRDAGNYRNVMLASTTGGLLASLDPEVGTLEPEARALVQDAKDPGRVVIGELFRTPEQGQVNLDIAAPVCGPAGKVLAVLLLRADPELRLFPFIQSWPTPSETAETLLVRRDGEEILFLNRLRHSKAPALTLRYPLHQPELPASQAVLGRIGASVGKDYRGAEVLADIHPVPGSSWFMIAKAETREVLAEARYRGVIILGFVGLGVLMIGLMMGLLFYLGQAKLYQNLFGATRLADRYAPEVPSRRIRCAGLTARAAGLVGLAVGALVLAGWAWDIPAMKSLLPGFVTMKTNTAIGFLLAGGALFLQTSRIKGGQKASAACAGALALLGTLTLAQYLFEMDLHIDQLLFREAPGALGTLAPNRMAPSSAMSFIFLGCGFILAGFRRTASASQWLALPVGLLSLLSLLGYFYGTLGAFGLGYYFQLAILTALAFIVLAAGLLLLNPSEGFMRRFMADSMGGWLLRRMMLIIPGMSILVGWVKALGERVGWYENSVGVALIVIAFTIILAAAAWWTARSLDHMDLIRSQAEAQVRESAEEIRATLYGIGDGVIATDAEGRLIHMNPAAERLTGWTESEALGGPLEDVFQVVEEDTLEPVENPIRRVLKNEPYIKIASHTLLLCKDGSRRTLADSAAPVRNNRGEIVRVVLIFRDETDNRRRERLTQIRTDLNEYADSHTLDDLIIKTLDETGAMVDSPIGFYHFYDESTGNLTLQQWSTRTLKEFCTAEGRGSHYPIDKAGVWMDCVRFKTPVIHNDYASLAHKKGLPPGHANVVRELVVPVMRAGKVVAILGVGNKPLDYTEQDTETVTFLAEATWAIIERKMVSTALEQSENRFRHLHESMRDAYAQVDMEGHIVDFNGVFQEMVGYSGEELKRLTYMDLTPPEWHALEAAIIHDEVLVNGYSKVYEKCYQRKDGVIFPAELRTCLLTDIDDKAFGMWAVIRDITDRKRAETFLKEAERTATGTLDALTEHLAILDENGTILDVNEAWRRFARENPPVNHTVCEGANYFEVCRAATGSDAEVAGAFMDGIRRVTEGRIAEYTQEYACHSPEIERWFSGRVTRFAGEGPLRIVVAHENITERKKTENRMVEALAEADRFKTAMDHLSAFVYIKDRQSRYIYANRPTLELFKCSAEELRGSDDARFFPPKTVAKILAVDARVLNEGMDTAEEIASTGADGAQRVYWEVKTPIYDQGEIWGLCGISTDITDRKKNEEVIKSKTELLDLAGTMAKVGGWEFEPVTLKGTWTDETARIHDVENPKDLGVSQGLRFYSEASAPKIASAVQEAIELGRPYDLELELISAKGVLKIVRTVGNPIRDEQGKIIKVRGMMQDITEIKEAQAEARHLLDMADTSRKALLSLLEDQKASETEILHLNADLERRVAARTLELAEANRELEAFAYSVSHDLRAPLRHMEGFLGMLARHMGDRLDEKGNHYLRVAQGASVRMGQLVEGLLSFSRLGRAELHMVKVDTAQLVAAVIEESKSEWGERKIRFEIGKLPTIQGDPTLLRLVFQNLIGNALKFTRNRPETVIEIQQVLDLANESGIAIRDNGAGFDPTYAHKLFGVFQRLHREEEFEGTGIGLANVHRIITRHGGRVWAEGRLGEGASFFLAFPGKEELS